MFLNPTQSVLILSVHFCWQCCWHFFARTFSRRRANRSFRIVQPSCLEWSDRSGSAKFAVHSNAALRCGLCLSRLAPQPELRSANLTYGRHSTDIYSKESDVCALLHPVSQFSGDADSERASYKPALGVASAVKKFSVRASVFS